MYQIKLLNAISDVVYSLLPQERYELSESIETPDGIIVRSASCKEMEFSPELKAIARAGAGVNNIPVERCSEEGIVVFNTPGANANAVKELVFAGMLMASRHLYHAAEWAQSLKGQDNIPALVEKGKKQFLGKELAGKTLGVIGLGAIGVLVANCGYALDMNVVGYDPFISVDHAWRLSRAVTHATDLYEMLQQCDFVSIHMPLTDKTRGFFDEKACTMLKPGATLLNFARGELADNQAIIKAIQEKRIHQYVCDFPSEELLGQDGVLCIPHLGASTPESEENCAKLAAMELRDYLENGNIKNSVNFPDCEMPRSGQMRVCVIHQNQPNMINQLTGLFSKHHINISNLLNKSRGNYAYTMIDLDDNADFDELNEVDKIDGVIRCIVYDN